MEKKNKTITINNTKNPFRLFKYIKGLALVVIIISNIVELISHQTIDNQLIINFISFLGISIYLFYIGGKVEQVSNNRNLKNSGILLAIYLSTNFIYILVNGAKAGLDYRDVVIFVEYLSSTAFLIPLIFVPLIGQAIITKIKFLYKNIFVFISFIICIFALSMYLYNFGISIIDQTLVAFIPYLIGVKFADYLENVDSNRVLNRDIFQVVVISSLVLVTVIFVNPLLPFQFDIYNYKQIGIISVLGVIIIIFLAYILLNRFKIRSIKKILRRIYEIDSILIIAQFIYVLVYLEVLNYKFLELSLMLSSVLVVLLSIILLSNIAYLFKNKFLAKYEIKTAYLALNIIFAVVFFSLNFGLIYAESGQLTFFPKELNTVVADNVEKLPNLDTYMSREWIIKSTKLSKTYTKSVLVVTLDYPLENEHKIYVNIKGDKYREDLLTTKIDEFNYKLEIDSIKYNVGRYTFMASIPDLGLQSPENSFNISYPLFITWTIDYEGGNISDTNLNAMSKVMDDYKIPVTHMFNPRIYMAPEISKSRRDFLTSWVLNRYEKKNDEVALHLHMWTDMVNYMGITAKTTPAWDNRTNGQSVLTSAYNYDEFTAMLLWSKAKFKENGLPRPYTYRAGGWFLELPQLRALQDQGFKIDTSGRNSTVWGNVKEPWILNEVSRPYKPSTKNQNKSSPAPLLNLWEFPNNGYDSTHNEAEVLKKAFDLNFNGQPLTSAQTLTYLSHPDYFADKDAQRMVELIEYINAYKAKDDNGPVFYFTLMDSLNNWE
jgi:hypothetical protein